MMVDMEAPDTSASSSATSPHSVFADPIVRLDGIGTVAFIITAVLAAVVFTNPVKVVAVIVALVLFTVGVFAFLWSYWTAVQRSRTDEIAVAQLYFLTGTATPQPVKRTLNGLLLIQVAVALATAIARNRTDGQAGSTLAFGILVPMFGLGLNGLWCALHGRFGPRLRDSDEVAADTTASADADAAADADLDAGADSADDVPASVPDSHDEMEQNSRHG